MGAIILKPNSKLGWWETDLDSSSDTLTPQRVNLELNLNTSGVLRPNNELVSSMNAVQLRHPETIASSTPLRLNPELSPSKGKVGAALKPLLPFSVTPPKPSGPSEAEMKLEALTASLEEELERAEQSEFFGECCCCNERVTGAGQACQVMVLYIKISWRIKDYIQKFIFTFFGHSYPLFLGPFRLTDIAYEIE